MASVGYRGLFGAMLALAGCVAQPQQMGPHVTTITEVLPFQHSYALPSRMSPDQRATQIAVAYDDDIMEGGMADVIHDIEGCYGKTATRVGNLLGLRDCMTLDYTAYNIDQVDGRRNKGRSLPFFTDAAMKSRLAQYGPVARFDSVDRMLAYLKGMHQLVQRHIIVAWKVANGHCPRDVTDPDCGYVPAPR